MGEITRRHVPDKATPSPWRYRVTATLLVTLVLAGLGLLAAIANGLVR
ncbi:MAG: hypothetical protein ACRDJ9_15985 [Dehalococcoidia bacterium]